MTKQIIGVNEGMKKREERENEIIDE